VVVHAWSLLGERKSFDERSFCGESSDGFLAEARVARMPGLKALALEAQEHFESIITTWYDARYGAGWSDMRGGPKHDSTRRFLSQWYKLSIGHGMLRRWYRGESREPNATVWMEVSPRASLRAQRRSPPPLAIVRMRPDHLLLARWNLTRAAAEFMARRPTRASGGTFIAVWGPNFDSFCSDRLCPDTFTEVPKSLSCYGHFRLDDQFAFGTPEAMDAYAAPYHPYSRDGLQPVYKCSGWNYLLFTHALVLFTGAEPYVTTTIMLGGLVEIGAHQSRGGTFGSLGLPGSCGHRLGHDPIRAVYLSGLDEGRNFTAQQQRNRGQSPGRGKAFLEYTEEVVPYGPVRDQGSLKGLSERAFFEARDAKLATRAPGFSDDFDTRVRVPGPFVNDKEDPSDNSSFRTAMRHVVDSPPSALMLDAEGRRVRANRRLRHGLSFSELCAPVYYFPRTGIFILRTHEAWRRAAALALKYVRGACAPWQQRDHDNKGSTCSDTRRPPEAFSNDSRISSVLHHPSGPCECGPAFALEPHSTSR
jgi:hypothetical protein